MKKGLLLSASLLLAAAIAVAGVGGIAGQVVDARTGEPIANALVVAHNRQGTGQARTDDHGRYVVENLEPGRYRVAAKARGYMPSEYPGPVVVEQGRVTPDINFRLRLSHPELGAIAGRVTDALTGEPVRGALVVAAHGHIRYKARTDARGRYVIRRVLPGQYDVGCKARHYVAERYPRPVPVEAGQVTSGIDFALTPKPKPGAIAGHVSDARTGDPIAGALVVARGERGFGRALTDRHGNYAIRGLPPGAYQVSCYKRGFQPETFPRPVPVHPSKVTRDVNFRLHPLLTDAE